MPCVCLGEAWGSHFASEFAEPRPSPDSCRTGSAAGGELVPQLCLGGKKEPLNPGAEGLGPAVMLVGDTGFEPVTSSGSRKRATTAPIARDVPKSHIGELRAIEVETGFEPV